MKRNIIVRYPLTASESTLAILAKIVEGFKDVVDAYLQLPSDPETVKVECCSSIDTDVLFELSFQTTEVPSLKLYQELSDELAKLVRGSGTLDNLISFVHLRIRPHLPDFEISFPV